MCIFLVSFFDYYLLVTPPLPRANQYWKFYIFLAICFALLLFGFSKLYFGKIFFLMFSSYTVLHGPLLFNYILILSYLKCTQFICLI